MREVEVDPTNVRMSGDNGCNGGALVPTHIDEGFHVFEPIVTLQCVDLLRSLNNVESIPKLPILEVGL